VVSQGGGEPRGQGHRLLVTSHFRYWARRGAARAIAPPLPGVPRCSGVSGPWRAGRPCRAADAVRRQPLAVEGEDQGATCHGRAVTGTMSGPRLHRRGAAGDGMTLQCTRATRGNAHHERGHEQRQRQITPPAAWAPPPSTRRHAQRTATALHIPRRPRSAGQSPGRLFERGPSIPVGGTAGRPAEQRSLFALQF
jgi:hypothetical protein